MGDNTDAATFYENIREPEWIREMRRHYAAHGHYRPDHLRRLLGDPMKSVGPPGEVFDAIAAHRAREDKDPV